MRALSIRVLVSVPMLLPTSMLLAGESLGGNAIEEIVVTAHSREYRLDNADTAFGLNLDLLDTPAAISVITADLLRDQQVNNVDDALRNVAGITKFKTGNGGEEKFSIRGFDSSQSIYKDGARINNSLNASNIPSTETANLDRIEVLKGASALLYGQGEPGGIINYITKRPEFERRTSVEVLGGNDSFYKAEFDTTGAFGDTPLAYRIVAAYQDSNNFRDEVFRERLLINPTLAWMPTEATEVVFGYEYINDEYTQDRGQVLDGNAIDGYFYSGRQDASQFYGIPDWNEDTTAESMRFYILAEHRISDNWTVKANYSLTENDKVNVDSSPFFVDSTTRAIVGALGSPVENLVAIGPRKTDGGGETSRYTLSTEAMFEDGFGFDHRVFASFGKEDFETTSTSFRGDRNILYNLATGAYATTSANPVAPGAQEIRLASGIVFGLASRGARLNQKFEEAGINVVDYIRFNDLWAWLIGGRYSDYKDKLGDFDDDQLSMRTGLVFNARPDLSFYLSYSQGYTSSGGRLGAGGGQIDPETSESIELGAKFKTFDERLLLTATLFNTEKQDLAFVVNPTDPPAAQFFGNLGAIQSQGFELEAVGFINERWRVQAGYAYIDNEISDGGVDNYGSMFPEGNSLGGIADHNLNLYTFYEIPVARGILGLGGGLYYQDDVFISTENNAQYDAWTQVDLAAYYKRGAWKLQVNVNNVADEDYRQAQALTTSDAFAAIRVGTGAPRSVVASVAVEF